MKPTLECQTVCLVTARELPGGIWTTMRSSRLTLVLDITYEMSNP